MSDNERQDAQAGTGPDVLVAVPDTDNELGALLIQLEELLLCLPVPGDDPDDWEGWTLPEAPLGNGEALAALRRIVTTLRAAERGPAAQPVAPDGEFELVALRFVTLERSDLALLGRAVTQLGQATLPGGNELVAEVLAEHADVHRRAASELVAGAARAHGLLDLEPDDDTALLAARLPATAGRVVLTGPEQKAYDRLTGRVLAMFHTGDHLARFIYRGTEL